MFKVTMGKPEVRNYWDDHVGKLKSGTASKDEKKMAKKLLKAFKLLANDPKYPGLNSHDIDDLSVRYGKKVWESYLENNTPAAGRIFWSYRPSRSEITIIAIEQHPNSGKSNAYDKIVLSMMGVA